MGLIYADLTSAKDIDALVSNLVAAMTANGPGWLRAPERWALNAVLRREVTRVASSERGTPTVTLTAAGQAGLREYLQGPVRGQLRQQLGHVPEEVTFVYGHTHKPFVDQWSVPGFLQYSETTSEAERQIGSHVGSADRAERVVVSVHTVGARSRRVQGRPSVPCWLCAAKKRRTASAIWLGFFSGAKWSSSGKHKVSARGIISPSRATATANWPLLGPLPRMSKVAAATSR
jgi:hypothetical protein